MQHSICRFVPSRKCFLAHVADLWQKKKLLESESVLRYLGSMDGVEEESEHVATNEDDDDFS